MCGTCKPHRSCVQGVLCFTGQGWGCAYALVPKNDSCVQTQCVRQHCRVNQGQITCICEEQKCLSITAGRQLICGQCNGTHVSSAEWTYPFDTYQVVGSNGESSKLNNWQYEQTHNQDTKCYRAKKGYVFLFNGIYMTETPNRSTDCSMPSEGAYSEENSNSGCQQGILR